MMESVWDLLQYVADTLSSFCPVQFLPIAAATVLEVEGQRYRVLKQVMSGQMGGNSVNS